MVETENTNTDTKETIDSKSSSSTVSNPYDPLVLTQSDTPGLKLVNELLEEHNYNEWNRAMLLSLSAKKKLGLIDGTITAPPSNDAKFPLWRRCNDMVLSWIVHAVQPRIARSVMFSTSATDVWSDLKDMFSQGDDTRMYQIKQEISEIRQDQESVSMYYTKLKTLWDKITSYSKPIICTCNASKQFADGEEKERVMQFLMGLNDSYSIVRGSILMMNPLPDTRKVHSLVLQHERQMEAANRRDNISSTHGMQTSYKITSNNRKPTVCSHCESNHSTDQCWYIIGFPPGHRFHGKNIKPFNKKAEAHIVESETKPDNGGHLLLPKNTRRSWTCSKIINILQTHRHLDTKKMIGMAKPFN